MRRVLLSSLFALVALVPGGTALASGHDEIDWSVTQPESGTAVGSEVEVTGPGTHRLVTIENPAITDDHYEIQGTVRYTGVEGAAYLEMWSFFSDGGSFFSRTLASEGPMASLTGDSNGREFVLPFNLNGSLPPVRIEVNVVLPGAGAVWVGPLSLEGFGTTAAWWSERTSAVIGASMGVAVGLAGAIIGLLSGRRRAQKTVARLLVGGIAVGTLSLLAGGVALLVSQPRHVWYPLLLIGVILVVVDSAVLMARRRARAAAELTRIKAMDTPV